MSDVKQSQLSLVALIAALAVGTVGYFLGVARRVEPQGYFPATESAPEEEAPLAPTHAELASAFRPRDVVRQRENLAAIAADRPDAAQDREPPTEQQWDEAAAGRSELRAYNGAPPVIPHAIDQRGFPSCQACHLDGLVLEDRRAPAMSHEPMASCAQCHVPRERPVPGPALADGPPLDNSFEGLSTPGRGARAWIGAPPVMPHTTLMRQRCDSCHGVIAAGLYTTHPGRQSCPQCHAPAAGLDQRRQLAGPPALPQAPPPLPSAPARTSAPR